MNSVIPVYYQIKQTIKTWILNKEFGAGEKLPSESKLIDKFNASRITIRQAIAQLIQEGFLVSRRGAGTFVTTNSELINSMSVETTGFMDDLFLTQISNVQTKFVEIKKTLLPKHVGEKLRLNDSEIVEIKRVRLLNGKPFTYSVNYLPLTIGLKINEKDLHNKLLVEILEKDFDIRFEEGIQTVKASFADEEVAKQLEIAQGSPILFVERIMYSLQHKPVELFQSSYRGELFEFIVRFKRIKKRGGNGWVQRLD
jgi:GntR family transcriptional regulator